MAFTQKEREAIVSQIVTDGQFGENESESLLKLTDNQLVALAKPEELDRMVDVLANEETKTPTLEDVSDEDLEMEVNKRKKKKMEYNKNHDDKKTPTGNQEVSLEKWLESAPPEVQRLVTNAQQVEMAERNRLIAEITANESCPLTEDQLKARSTEDLRAFAAIASVRPGGMTTNDHSGAMFPTFVGAAGSRPNVTANKTVKPTPLGLPEDITATS